MDVEIILNPSAGRGRGAERFGRLPGLPPAWGDAVPVRTRGPGHAASLAAAAADRGAGLLVVAGGDGPLHESVNGLMRVEPRRRPTVAHLPVGTGCDFARALGLSDRRGALRGSPSDWQPRAVDVGEIAPERGDRCWCVTAANIGRGPTVARWETHTALRRFGRPANALAAAAAILPGRPQPLTVESGAVRRDGPTLNLSVCNGPYFGGGMQPCPSARLDDGLLQVAWVRDMGRLAAVARLPGLMRGSLRDHPRLDPSRIATFGLLISRQEGAFRIDIEAIRTMPLPGES